ncbi:DUF551 domain-containing protein [Enterobacter roggenkampii]|uniref:DUF551 domain-containing protein n=1 Tax=Enterobacter roggenkampii TaxID=1812935 RepID=UPI002074EEBC|nr:DUF551 domain-containing protein [Enterobacter roggenkampii]MCM6993509.1 DUF551 domain-containing protein [Enterobacter roggenkampii]
MTELTKEWLLRTIAELEEVRDSMLGVVNEDAAMALAAMKLALASLEAEAVAFRSKLKPPSAIGSESWDYTDHRQPDAFELESCVIERLYTAPPAPVSVPEGALKMLLPDVEKSEFWFEHDGKILFEGVKFNNAVFEACRAAMLQGAVGNSPVIPDGWVACSERMPEEGSKVIVFRPRASESNDPPVKTATYNGGREYYHGFDCYCEPTHWMPLPAAPQQEDL